MKFSSYLKFLACLVAIGSVAVAGVNWIIDPFYLFEAPRISGLNAAKTGFFQHLRLMKPLVLEAKRNAFDTIILGSSRAEAGLDPEHPAWGPSKVYNLSIPAPNMYELLRYYEFANEVQNLRTVVLALDFSQFDSESQTVTNYEVDHLLQSIHASSDHYRASNLVTTLFSSDALSASMRTVISQHNPKVEHTPLGFGIHAWRRVEAARIGQRAVFIDNDKQYISNHWARNGSTANSFGGSQSKPMAYFRQLVEESRMNGTQLIVVLSPSHAREWSSIWAAGLWPQVEQWKRDLVTILAEDAARHPGKDPSVLWDFSGYNSITTEAVPQGGDTNTQMRWYWEASHYKKEVGDMILEKIFDYHNPKQQVPADFGIKLTLENIDEHLQAMREQQLIWHLQHQQDLQEIMGFVKVAQKERRLRKDKKV
jgi:hypothetical protein